MHKASLPPEFKALLRERRAGRQHVFDVVDSRHMALLVIDMQNVFVAPGAPLEVPHARGIVANINRLAGCMRRHGSAVVWIRSTFSERGRSGWPLYFSYFAAGADLRAHFMPGAEGHAFWRELDRHDDDLVIDKDRFSAFIEGASMTERRLVDLGIDTLVVTGTLTNLCCESTVRDAMMRDFKCIMVEDANAARSDEDHLASLKNVAWAFGDVVTTGELIATLEARP